MTKKQKVPIFEKPEIAQDERISFDQNTPLGFIRTLLLSCWENGDFTWSNSEVAVITNRNFDLSNGERVFNSKIAWIKHDLKRRLEAGQEFKNVKKFKLG